MFKVVSTEYMLIEVNTLKDDLIYVIRLENIFKEETSQEKIRFLKSEKILRA